MRLHIRGHSEGTLVALYAYDALPKGSEQRGAYLRREGLYSSHLAEWRKQGLAAVADAIDPPTPDKPAQEPASAGEGAVS